MFGPSNESELRALAGPGLCIVKTSRQRDASLWSSRLHPQSTNDFSEDGVVTRRLLQKRGNDAESYWQNDGVNDIRITRIKSIPPSLCDSTTIPTLPT